MKKTVEYVLAALASIGLFGACMEQEEMPAQQSTGLRAVLEDDATRASFSDLDGKLTWNIGDQVAVHYQDGAYQTYEVWNPQSGAIAPMGTITSVRDGYSVYPASAVEGITYTSGSVLQVKLPATYDISAIVAGSDANRGKDFSPVPMVGKNDPVQDVIYLRHVSGLIRIKCKDLPAGTKTITVTLDKDVTGTYTVDVTNMLTPTITTAGNASNNTVTFTVSESGLAEGAAVVLNVPVPCGTYNTVTVTAQGTGAGLPKSQTFNDAPLNLARHHGRLLVQGEVGFTYHIGTETLNAVSFDTFGGTREFSEGFYSYKQDSEGDRVAVPFHFEYSLDGGTTWTTTKPDWLLLDSSIDYAGYTSGHRMDIGVSPQTNQVRDLHREALQNKALVSNKDLSTVNVATGATVSRTTANSYVVQAPGTYRFPLVFGNAIKNNATNEIAYHRRVNNAYVDTDEWGKAVYGVHGTFGYFKDHLNHNITKPYIAQQHPSFNASTWKAVVVWTDEPGLVENPTVSGSGTNAYISFSVPKENICQGNAIIALTTPGNAIAWSWHIWVTDQDLRTGVALQGPSGVKFAPVNIGWCDTQKLEDYPERRLLVRAVQDGRPAVDNGVEVFSAEGRAVIRGGNSSLYQYGRKDPIFTGYMYQHGADAPVAQVKTYYSPNNAYPVGIDSEPQLPYESYLGDITDAMNGIQTIGRSIQNPHKMLRAGLHREWWEHNWCYRFIHNLWDSPYEVPSVDIPHGRVVSKSIYDPSPVGYKVPQYDVFSSFTESNTQFVTKENGDKGLQYGNSLFFPIAVYRNQAGQLISGRGLYLSAHDYKASQFQFNCVTMLFNMDFISQPTETAIGGAYYIRPIAE